MHNFRALTITKFLEKRQTCIRIIRRFTPTMHLFLEIQMHHVLRKGEFQ